MALDDTILVRRKIPMLLENRSDEGITFAQEDSDSFDAPRVRISGVMWREMGRPVEVTVTVEPFNTMDTR